MRAIVAMPHGHVDELSELPQPLITALVDVPATASCILAGQVYGRPVVDLNR